MNDFFDLVGKSLLTCPLCGASVREMAIVDFPQLDPSGKLYMESGLSGCGVTKSPEACPAWGLLLNDGKSNITIFGDEGELCSANRFFEGKPDEPQETESEE